MLMQNVDLTWAQDPGAVTELLSGDFFVPFGRSTSHQLWSSAMVITPTLRGLFGITLDAATNTITVNPHLPANWDHAQICDLHFGDQRVMLMFYREKGRLEVELRDADRNKLPIHLLSDVPGAQVIQKPRFSAAQVSIPLPPLELSSPTHSLPTPGARPGQMKILSTTYGPRSLTVKLSAQPGTDQILTFNRNQPVAPHLSNGVNDKSGLVRMAEFSGAENKEGLEPSYVRLRLPEGEGYQTPEFTLTW